MKKLRLQQIKTGAIISYFSLAINILTGIVYTPWMVQKIGQSNYGLYTLATSLINIFLIDFGLGSAVSRFISKYRAEGDQKSADNIIGIICKLYIFIDVIIFLILFAVFFFIDNIYKNLTVEEMEIFRILYIIVSGFSIISFPLSPLNGILNAYEKFIQLKLCDLLNRILTIFFVVSVLFITDDVVFVVLANAISSLIILLAKLVIVKNNVPLRINWTAKGRDYYKSLFGFTVWTTVTGIMQRIAHSFSPSILAINNSSIEIALYSPAITLEGYFYMIATAVNGLFLPRVSKYIADKKEDKLLALMIKVGKYQILVLGVLFVGFVCLGKEFMILWMGKEYEKSYYCAMILLLPSLIGGTQQIANTTVIAKNLIKYQSYCMIFNGVLGVVFSFILSINMGAIGVCLGISIYSMLNIIFMNYIYLKKANINIFEFYRRCYLKAIPLYIFSIIVGLFIAKLINVYGWFGFVLKAMIVVLVFIILTIFLFFSKQERINILKRFKSLLKIEG